MSSRGSWIASLLAGLMAGVAGTVAMDAFWRADAKLTGRQSSGDEDATAKVAADLLRKTGIRVPSRATRRAAGQIVHWGYGAGWGALVGLGRSRALPADFGWGLPLGAGLWAIGDEWTLYWLGYAKHPREYPLRIHLESLAAHLVYGFGLWAALAAERGLSRSRLGEKSGLPKVA